ncbi:coiled-coil domain-containing protein 63 isoform X2 [Gallus gallus]|uniref:coiled-coil domain-containing protein 63 isoform X2 n=1 Tax=Gallus gallus TaxID=9031 RepID=UPI000739E826|nr:coiled-coil domain-containing protein 63 isoform X2 [Gallus gallus]|eukprot:XP_015131063.1 coiled-coil domain-containing protein 63 isoform X2 [Gallus gallus]
MKGSKLRGSSSMHMPSDFPVTERQAQLEFYRLQKQLQIAVEKRKSSGASMRQQMQTQEKEIQSLKQEHKEMSLLLSKIRSLRNMIHDDRICMELKCLLQTKDQYDCLIRDRKALVSELDNEILELQKKVERENVITTKVKQANCSKWLQDRTQTLELHLNNVTVRFDTILTTNNKLQEEIENLRIQKATLDNFYSKLHKHLAQQKRRMDTAIEQATQARKQRVEFLARISAMNERHRQNTAQYNIEMQERERIRDQENKLKTFVLAKYTDRSELEEQAKKKEALKAAQRMKRSQGESFESREVTYRRLLELAENGDINQLVDGFIEKEGKNFAYFSYATELNSEMEKLQQRIKNLQNEIALFMTDQENTESSSLHVLKELEEELSQNTEKANDYEDRCKESSKVLGQLKSAIEVLFKENNCDATKIREQLGDKGQITDLNLMQYLGLVEKKTNELLLMESILLYTEADGSLTAQSFDNPLLGGTSLLRGMEQSHLCPPPPALLGTNDAADAFEVPLDHAQLRELLLSKYQKEQGSAARADKKGKNDIKA